MGLLGKMFGKQEDNASAQPSSGGTYLVEDVFELKNSLDLVVVGQIKGTVRVNDKIYVEGAAENDLISIKELNIFKTKVQSATDTAVAICLEDGIKYGISKGMVLYVRP